MQRCNLSMNLSKSKICKTELISRHSLSGPHGFELCLLLLTFELCWKAHPFPGLEEGGMVPNVIPGASFLLSPCWLEGPGETVQDAQGQTHSSEQTERKLKCVKQNESDQSLSAAEFAFSFSQTLVPHSSSHWKTLNYYK